MDIANLRGLTNRTTAISEFQDTMSRMAEAARGISGIQDSVSAATRGARELAQAMNIGLPDALKALHVSPFDNLLKEHKRMLGITNPLSEWSNSVVVDFARGLSPLSSRISEQFSFGISNLSLPDFGINNPAIDAFRSFQEQQDLYVSRIREAADFGGISHSLRTAMGLLNDELLMRDELASQPDMQEALETVGAILEPDASPDSKKTRTLFLQALPTVTLVFLMNFIFQYLLPAFDTVYAIHSDEQNRIERTIDREYAKETREINAAQYSHLLSIFEEMKEAVRDKDLYRVKRNVGLMNEQKFKGELLFQLKVGEVVEVIAYHGKWVFVSAVDYQNNTIRTGWVMKKYLLRLPKDQM